MKQASCGDLTLRREDDGSVTVFFPLCPEPLARIPAETWGYIVATLYEPERLRATDRPETAYGAADLSEPAGGAV